MVEGGAHYNEGLDGMPSGGNVNNPKNEGSSDHTNEDHSPGGGKRGLNLEKGKT